MVRPEGAEVPLTVDEEVVTKRFTAKPSSAGGAELARTCRAGGTVAIGRWETRCPFVFADLDTALIGHPSSGALRKVVDVAGEQAMRDVIEALLEG